MNCTVSVQFFCERSCAGQFVVYISNTFGWVTVAGGLLNVIGNPVLAEEELVSVNVSSF